MASLDRDSRSELASSAPTLVTTARRPCEAQEGNRSGVNPVRIADPAENYGGDSRKNIVNRLTAGGGNGVQIEQSLEARTEYWQAIADAVAAVYRKRLTRK